MNKEKNHSDRFKILLAFIVCMAVVAGIIYMKRSAADDAPGRTTDTLRAAGPVAVPDTSLAPNTLPAAPDTVVRSVVADTLLGVDKRAPYEAGYEDGYSAGCDDGAAKQQNATYDDNSNYPAGQKREEYRRGYREGYAKGYDDGQSGKQFNI